MNKKMFYLVYLLALLSLVFNTLLYSQEKDILIGLKLYQGKRNVKDKIPDVVSSFSLKPFYSGGIVSEDSYRQERDEIKRIFQLKDLAEIAKTNWGWGKEEERKHEFNVAVNGKSFTIHTELKEKSTFKIEIKMKKGEKWSSLFNSGVILPQQKSMVFGFDDPEKKTYFLSISRGLDRNIGYVKQKKSFWIDKNEIPKIKKYVKPELSEEIKKKGRGGLVLAIALINEKGRVVSVKQIKGTPILIQSVKDAVMQWEYEPYILNGKAVPVKFTVGVEFNFQNDKRWVINPVLKNIGKCVPSIWPVRGYVTSTFGYRKNPFSGKKEFHRGLDISSRLGYDIHATADGKIKFSGVAGVKGFTIIIDHQNGFETEYQHLYKDLYVKKGDCVVRGQKIAAIGNSGRSTGSHLHYEIRKNGKCINPIKFISN